MSFSKLNLCEPILKAIKEEGYTSPTPVQSQAIPYILEGRDILAGAQTGTGKTAGFTLPMLELLTRDPKPTQKNKVRVLILTPTRELAAQVGDSVSTYGKYLPYKSAIVFGGVGINPQIAALKKGLDILIATPGRLLDLIGQKCVDLSSVEMFILDEADRMLDMGFINDIKKVIALLPQKRQTLLFSATYSDEIKKLCSSILKNPATVEVARANTSSELVTQKVIFVDCARKTSLLAKLILQNKWEQVLVFTRTKHHANKLSDYLIKIGVSAAAIHGNKGQGARTKALADFKSGEVKILVATDIAARGLDIDQLPHVVNFELPNIAEDYVHRIGRTGRAGNEGEALSLVCVDEHEYLKGIEKLINKKIPSEIIEGYEPDPSIKAQPITQGRGGNGGGGRGQSQNPRKQNNQSSDKRRDGQSSYKKSEGQSSKPSTRHSSGNRGR